MPYLHHRLFTTYGSTNMDVDGVCTHIREDGETLPLFVVPKDGNDSVSFLKEWVKSNKPWLKQKLIEHGTRTCIYSIPGF